MLIFNVVLILSQVHDFTFTPCNVIVLEIPLYLSGQEVNAYSVSKNLSSPKIN